MLVSVDGSSWTEAVPRTSWLQDRKITLAAPSSCFVAKFLKVEFIGMPVTQDVPVQTCVACSQ